MKIIQILRNRVAALSHDILVIPIAWFGAYWLRFNLEAVPAELLRVSVLALPIVIGTTLTAVAIFFATRMNGIPRSIFPIYGLLLLTLVGGPRFVYRWVKDRRLYVGVGKRALIMGAGRAGEMLVRDLLRDPAREYDPVGFVDDDVKKRGKEIHGVGVLGSTADIPDLVADIDVILIAVPSARSKDMRRIVGICEKTQVAFRTLPRLEDVVTGKATIKALRDVKIDDLLGREPVTLEWDAIRQSSQGKCVLVTGGG